MALQDIVRRLDTLATTASLGGRTLLGLDTNPVPADWNHITKVDPEHGKKLPLAFPLYLSHTSAVSVGGSQDVTEQNTEETFELVTAAGVPAFHEPSAATHVTEQTRNQADFIALPEVLNGDSQALVGTLGEGIEYVREELAPSMISEKLGVSMDGALGDRLGKFAAAYMLQDNVFEAYIIMNEDSAAAREANVGEDDLLSPQEAKQRAMAAEYHLESEIIYLEYSGTFGGQEAVDILEQIDEGVSWSRIWYGGGLDNRENATKVLDAGADAVIVGDVFHDIAREEADLVERAREAFDETTDTDELREWITDGIEVSETSAARYLSTIPNVPDPEERAARYLAAGVELALAADPIVGSLDDPDESEVRETLDDGDLPGEAAFTDSDADAHDVARRLTEGLLAERYDLAFDDQFASRHLAVDL
jgi:phosphoglycerol geranylgeranyltransferase